MELVFVPFSVLVGICLGTTWNFFWHTCLCSCWPLSGYVMVSPGQYSCLLWQLVFPRASYGHVGSLSVLVLACCYGASGSTLLPLFLLWVSVPAFAGSRIFRGRCSFYSLCSSVFLPPSVLVLTMVCDGDLALGSLLLCPCWPLLGGCSYAALLIIQRSRIVAMDVRRSVTREVTHPRGSFFTARH